MSEVNQVMVISGIVLAGGKSSRMGRNKANLMVGNHTMLGKTIEKLRCVSDDIIIVSDRPGKFSFTGTREVTDIYKEKGPLGGIHAGLSAARYSNAFITACDMPFWQPEMVALLLDSLQNYDVVIPMVDDYIEPLFAIYSTRCLSAVEVCLQQGILRIIEVLSRLRVNYIYKDAWNKFGDIDEIFMNINTPQELKHLLVRDDI